MSTNRKTTVGVIFGGRSVEHDVSIITGHQVMRAFDPELFEVVPVYIDRDGRWFSGDPLLDLKNFNEEVTSYKGVASVILSPGVQHHGLIINPTAGRFDKSQVKRLDVVFPAIHGTHGEDGTLQGLLELADIAYVGCGVLASAVANDKITTKALLKQHGIPVVDGVTFSRNEWLANPDAIVKQIMETLPQPVFIKPATLGSSIGIARVDEDDTLLRMSIEVATNYDQHILVESAVRDCVEINCAVMGPPDQASVCEQPVTRESILSFDAKYKRGGKSAKLSDKPGGMASLDRIIPAPISAELTQRVQTLALRAFRTIGAAGTARIDFLFQPQTEALYLNEVNSIPGSLAYYLWEASGVPFDALVEKLVTLALQRHEERSRTQFSFEVNLLRKKNESVSEIERAKP